MIARRALLYVPGDDERKIKKSASLKVDTICLDMEDGVASNRKAEARKTIQSALGVIDFGDSERLVRINPVGSGLEEDDLLTILPLTPDGIVIPKVTSAKDIQQVRTIIDRYAAAGSNQKEALSLLAIVESARGIINLREICQADPRLEAIIFGAEDFAEDIGALRTISGWEVFYARSAVIVHTAAFGLQAIDMVFVDFKNIDSLMSEARAGTEMGFSGKQIIHPNQVEPVQEAFTPDDSAIAYAKKVVNEFEENQRLGRGAFAIDGRMIDAPVVKSARNVLLRAQAAGKIDLG